MQRQSAISNVLAVGGASLLYVGLEVLKIPKRWSFLGLGLILVLYGIHLVRRRTESWRALGFRGDNLVAGFLPVGLCTVLAGAGLFGFAVARGRAVWSREVLLLLVAYPVWALVQQLAFQGLFHRGLMVLVRAPVLQVVLTAGAFACVHFGNPALVALTFMAGLLWSVLYRRWPNLWLLAGSHTVLAALAYPLVLADAPLSRF
jgi:membrane protease YdiL (CAAX protease family)